MRDPAVRAFTPRTKQAPLGSPVAGEMVEYDPTTFAVKQTAKVLPEAVASPEGLSVNRLGEMLLDAPVSLPLSEGDLTADKRVWFWDGHAAALITRDVARTTSTAGSNLAISESAPVPDLRPMAPIYSGSPTNLVVCSGTASIFPPKLPGRPGKPILAALDVRIWHRSHCRIARVRPEVVKKLVPTAKFQFPTRELESFSC